MHSLINSCRILMLCLLCFSVQSQDWLIDNSSFVAEVIESKDEIVIGNGLFKRTFRLTPNFSTISLDQLTSKQSLLRGVKPEARIVINGDSLNIGGLIGQSNYAFLMEEELASMSSDPDAFQYKSHEVSEITRDFGWKQVRHHKSGATWPPKGKHLSVDFAHGDYPSLMVTIHYEVFDGIPVYSKWMTMKNMGEESVMLNAVTTEILAAVEFGSMVENRDVNVDKPNIHVETDYAFSSFNAEDANHHVVHWKGDPDYHSQVNYLKQTTCLLEVSPEMGPAVDLLEGGEFQSYKTFVLLYDSYDRERKGLALRKMYRVLAPWTTENPLMMHARFADWDQVKLAIDQAAEVGFEMVILTFGSGFNIEDDSPEYIAKMKQYSEYAQAKGVEIGGYSLLASRSVDAETDVVMPAGEKPTFGNSPCLGSQWSDAYFNKLYGFYEASGFTLLEHDGSYPGDFCMSEDHPGHQNFGDSRWNQYQVIQKFYQWCRTNGIYLNVPDYYYLSGSNKCGMGYREVNWSLPREQQQLHTRQNIYDGSWEKTPSMGWMFVPLTEYHGGGEAATVEPLSEHLDHYEKMMVSNLSAGVQACYRGPRLFDTESTKSMVKKWVTWFKEHREVLEGDVIHLRRADGRDIDYWLNVNPGREEKGLLMVFNPTDREIAKVINVPLYYTGLNDQTEVSSSVGSKEVMDLNRDYSVDISVNVPAGGFVSYVFR